MYRRRHGRGRIVRNAVTALCGTPTSVAGNRVLLYEHSNTGGASAGRKALKDALADSRTVTAPIYWYRMTRPFWRYIRYAAKDWGVDNADVFAIDVRAAGCATMAIRSIEADPATSFPNQKGSIVVPLPGAGRYEVWLSDMTGRRRSVESAVGGSGNPGAGARAIPPPH